MIIESAKLIYFSPTGGTKKILDSITREIGIKKINSLDLTNRENRLIKSIEVSEELIIIGFPVYAEGVPRFLLECLNKIYAVGKPVVIVCVYGNIAYGIALNQLYSLALNKGMLPVGAGAFVAQHSFCSEDIKIAEGRPDFGDELAAESFGVKIREKIIKCQNPSDIIVNIPESSLSFAARMVPKNGERIVTRKPDPDMGVCTECGYCVNLCPMGAVDKESKKVINSSCIRCFRCVKGCSQRARSIVFKRKIIVKSYLKAKGKKRKEAVVYI